MPSMGGRSSAAFCTSLSSACPADSSAVMLCAEAAVSILVRSDVIAFISAVPPPLLQADSTWQGFPDAPAAGVLLLAEPAQPATARQGNSQRGHCQLRIHSSSFPRSAERRV